MSGEYYCNEESVTTYNKDYSTSPSTVTAKENYETKGQDHRLHEIEEQLEMAEDRCNTLKGQLDYMKQLYGVRKSPRTRKISSLTADKKLMGDVHSTESTLNETTKEDESKGHLKRQNSNAIGTDNTGAAVITINNILNGITDSVNRLSELHVQIAETPGRNKKARSTGVSPHPITAMKITSHSNTEVTELHKNANLCTDSGNVQDMTGDCSSPLLRTKFARKRNKLLAKKPVSSQQSIRRNAKLDRKTRNFIAKPSTVDKSVTAVIKRRVLNSLKPSSNQSQSRTHKLVEIYHNTAAKNSDSDEGNLQRSKNRRPSSTVSRKLGDSRVSSKFIVNDVPPIDIKDKNERQCRQEGEGDASVHLGTHRSTEPPELDPLLAPRTEISCYSKNYELPTIASRMKQVAKSYLNSFTFKAIPFCAAISTSPSHNIGINIQQVMNIIKNRQPIKGISPTLAHNIGLAAERLNSRPLSALVSSVHCKTGYRITPCPLSKTLFNYPQLQEMARGIPEETVEEVQDEVDSPEVKTIIITGPSGDMEVKNRNLPVWAADPLRSENCTCVPQSGVELQQLVSKYRKPFPPPTAKSTELDTRVSKYNNLNRKRIMSKPYQEPKNGFSANKIKIDPQEIPPDSSPLQGREKNLKEVLTNLHDEFETLNKKYEELSNKACAEDQGTLKELENMEAELNKKEEEITMVMTLYKEVIALKQQIKSLKEKASQGSVNVNASEIKFKEYNNPQAAFHLTKLLRQIQHYQMRFKKDYSGV